jgi:hypothetical protein
LTLSQVPQAFRLCFEKPFEILRRADQLGSRLVKTTKR